MELDGESTNVLTKHGITSGFFSTINGLSSHAHTITSVRTDSLDTDNVSLHNALLVHFIGLNTCQRAATSSFSRRFTVRAGYLGLICIDSTRASSEHVFTEPKSCHRCENPKLPVLTNNYMLSHLRRRR
jgi:hypothetical protein